MRVCAVSLFSLIASLQLWAQCNPAPEVQAAIDKLPTRSADETSWNYQQKRQAAIQEMLARFPNDIFVRKLYVTAAERKADRDRIREEYKSRYEKNPDDAAVAYLYAITLEGRNSPEAIKILDAVLAKSPQFSWPHMELIDIYSTPVFQNKELVRKHADAFLSACPDTLEGYAGLRGVDDKQVLARYAAKLRSLLQTRTDKNAIEAYQTLWSIEFKAHATAEYDGLRKQVAADLKRLRALDTADSRSWYYTLEQGYKLANDPEQADWAKEERLRKVPEYWELASRDQWNKDNPRPNNDDPAAKKHDYYSNLLKKTDEWIKERPAMAANWESRLNALDYLVAPAGQIIDAADTFLKLSREDAGPDGPGAWDYLEVAGVCARKHLQPERSVEFSEKALARMKADDEPMWDGYATKDNLQMNDFYRAVNRIDLTGYEASAYIDMKQAAQARSALTRMDDQLEVLKNKAGDKSDFKRDYTIHVGTWWSLMARTAELEGHDQDAMAYYEHALLSRLEAKQNPETGVKDETAESARRLWTKLGGSNDGWQLWYGRQADNLLTQATLSWEDANEPLPAFELVDLKGKTWTQADMKGKTTFLNFWASW